MPTDYGSTARTGTSDLYGSYQSVPTKELDADGHHPGERRRRIVKALQLLGTAIVLYLAFNFASRLAWFHNDGDDGFSYQYTDMMNDTSQRILPPMQVHYAAQGINQRRPFSTLHPVELGVPKYSRPASSRPFAVLTHNILTDGRPTHFPTSAWYQNMLLVGNGEPPTEVNRVYATPFLVDAAGPIPGLRVLPNQVSASTSVVQVNTIVEYGLTVGAALDAVERIKKNSKEPTYSNEYRVERMTPLGLTLGWHHKSYPMFSSIVKGMPYGTMVYETTRYESSQGKKEGETWYPTVASQIPLAQAPIVDGKTNLGCLGQTFSSSNSQKKSTKEDEPDEYQAKVEKEIELHFVDSDFSWLVFVSKPVTIQCVFDKATTTIQLQVVDSDDDDGEEEPPFVIRIALAKFCTSNKNPIYCHHEQLLPYSLGLGQGRYEDLLRNHSRLVPGPNTDFDYNLDETKHQIDIIFDWDARDMSDFQTPMSTTDTHTSMDEDLIAFALPHHLDLMGTQNAPGYLKYCANTLIGPACMLSGSQWKMVEHVPAINFRAPRPPAQWAIKALAKSAKKDIKYRLPPLYEKGSGDTYFSGKMLAKLGRILAVVDEIRELCGKTGDGSVAHGYKDVCRSAEIPTQKEADYALATLRSSVEVWLSGKAVTPFVFDDAWGGVVSCGCSNPDGLDCRNKFPECPAFHDPGLNFGQAFYNDLHFHMGYHIYAAAVVAHFDSAWGKKYFERVLLLVRNIANPADHGDYFPAFRHKDWYQGHSWASGVVPPYLNGRNQESSSESIAAYEAVALYGQVMTRVFGKNNKQKQQVAKEVEEAGLVLTATELRSTRRYYHVRAESNANQALKIYPLEYNNHAIGMMWNTMAQFQTWFGGKPYLAVGIQLLPITPIAEYRDGVEWLGEMYPSFAKTCAANEDCEENGWSVLQLASLATIGYGKNAAKQAEALSQSVFASAGGNGHSLTNTLWYIATRAIINDPIKISNTTSDSNTDDGKTAGGSESVDGNSSTRTDHLHVLSHCYQPQVCTDYVLDTIADE